MPKKPPRDARLRVRDMVKTWPGVEAGRTYGFPAFKVGGRTFAWFPDKKEVEPGTLGVRMGLLEREHRIAARPKIYYVTPHYYDYPSALARPDRMTDPALRALLKAGYEFMLDEDKRRKARGKK